MFSSKRGALYYTVAGLMVVILVLYVALHTMNMTYRSAAAEDKEYSNFVYAIRNTHAMLSENTIYSAYPTIWKAGHAMDPDGVNTYLRKDEPALIDDLKTGFVREYNTRLCNLSKECTPAKYTLAEKDINITIEPITKDDVTITETDQGMEYSVLVSMRSDYRGYRYQDDKTIVTDVPARLLDMYERAKDFHASYASNIQAATTVALYTRAIRAAYDPTATGSFLKEGDISYDPLEPVVNMDLKALREDGIHPEAAGSVPAATYLNEWIYLGEPSILPPGIDANSPKYDQENSIGMLRTVYDLEGAMNCTRITDAEKEQECEDFYNDTKLREQAENLRIETDNLIKIQTDCEAWNRKYNKTEGQLKAYTCDKFRTETEQLILRITEKFGTDIPKTDIIVPATGYSEGSEDLLKSINIDNNNLDELYKAVSALKDISSIRLPPLADNPCQKTSDGDCHPCPHGPSDCDNPSCDYINCNNKCNGDDKDCGCNQGPHLFPPSKRTEEVDCEECETTCSGETCTETCAPTEPEEVSITQCNCECYPKPELTKDISTQLNIIASTIASKIIRLQEQETELIARANAAQAAQDKIDEINSLQSNVVGGYDVVSEIDFHNVRYNPDGNYKCYKYPTWQDRKNGTCADALKSTGLYTGQIAAATTCCAFIQACCPLVKYAARFYPVIFQTDGTYNISEKIVDDQNRMMLRNLFAPEDDLYGLNTTSKLFIHTAPEFVIYKDYKVKASSLTSDSVLVYIDMENTNNAANGGPAKKIEESFADPSCTGISC